MGKILMLNGSPRAPRSNSKQYAELFSRACKWDTEYAAITRTNHLELCRRLEDFSDLLFVFPLYADSLPVTLLHFLKTLEAHPPQRKPTVSVLINCGFLEPEQNELAVKILELYCRQNGYHFGSVLAIGGGEAILGTPFRIFVRSKLKKLAASLERGAYGRWKVTMPISKGMFLKASTKYWLRYGAKNGVTGEQMATMRIEE